MRILIMAVFVIFFAAPAEPPPAAAVASIGANLVIGIIIGIFVLFLIIVDISCYFINGCGLTMCICVQLCGRTKPKATPNEMEEGERFACLLLHILLYCFTVDA